MNEYCVVYDIKSYLRITATDDDTVLSTFAAAASRVLDAVCRRRFYPLIATRYYDHPRDARVLLLDDDLLEISSFTTSNGNVTLSASDYYLTCAGMHNMTPYDRIEMRADGDHPSLEYQETPQRASAVTGIWGYHESWSSAWDAVDALAAAVDSSTTVLSVNDADGTDLDGLAPRFKVGQLIKVDSEWLYVTEVTSATNTLTVRRAVNGSTAAAHNAAAAVSVYRPMPDIWHAARRLAAWLYGQRDQPYAERIQAAQQGTVTIPEEIPPDVRRVIARYAR